MSDPLNRAIAHFDVEEYREALLALEERWAVERSDFLRGLIQLCNALNQLRLGLVTAPRRLLASSERLLAAYAPRCEGIDVAAVLVYIASVRALIPDDIETGAGRVVWEEVPRLRLTHATTTDGLPPML